jgi:hypothetical protein
LRHEDGESVLQASDGRCVAQIQEERAWHYVDSDIAATKVRASNCACRTIDTILQYSRCHHPVSCHLVELPTARSGMLKGQSNCTKFHVSMLSVFA